MTDFIVGLNSPDVSFLSSDGILKLLFIVLIAGYILYSFLMTLRVRVLSDSVNTPSNNFTKMVTYSHLLISLIGGLFALILILLG